MDVELGGKLREGVKETGTPGRTSVHGSQRADETGHKQQIPELQSRNQRRCEASVLQQKYKNKDAERKLPSKSSKGGSIKHLLHTDGHRASSELIR